MRRLPARRIEGTKKTLARGPGQREESCLAGSLLSRGYDFVKLGGALLVLGENDVVLCIGGNGDDHTAVGIEAHGFGVTSCADVLGEPLPEHIVL